MKQQWPSPIARTTRIVVALSESEAPVWTDAAKESHQTSKESGEVAAIAESRSCGVASIGLRDLGVGRRRRLRSQH